MAKLALDIKIVFKLDDRKLTLDYRKLPNSAWSELKRVHGFTPKTLVDAIGVWDIDAIGAIIWLERKQRERNLSWLDASEQINEAEPEFDVVDIISAGRSMVQVLGMSDDEEEQEEDPT